MRWLLIFVLAFAAISLWWGYARISRPLADGFGLDGSHWTPYGGAWQLSDNVMRNNSDERGAKLLTGSTLWRDYSVEADVALLGRYGDTGLIVRATDPDVGVDSYRGFFAGLRTLDNTLILGRSDYGWEEYEAKPIPGNLQERRFYHLRLVAVGCAIAVRVDLPTGGSVREGVELTHCSRRGQVGVKSYQIPAQWSNFRVRPATRADLDRMMQGTPLGSKAQGTLHGSGLPVDDMGPIESEAHNHSLEGTPTPIAQLRLAPSSAGTQVSIRGTVRLLSPTTYVEDATGGIAVTSYDAPALAIGDDVEITGTVSSSSGQPVMHDGRVKILWFNSAPSPPLITADKAATGSEDGRLVVLDGRLLRSWRTPQQRVLELENGGEIFRVLAEANPYDHQLTSLVPQSELQVTGIIRSGPSFAGDSSFALLLSPAQDAVRVLHEAPWWTASHIAELSAVIVVLAVAGVFVYHRLKHRYLLHVVEERELLAHDLHDTVSQSFAGIGYQLRALEQTLDTEPTYLEELGRAQKLVRDSHEELRRSITSLRINLSSVADIGAGLECCARRLVQGGNTSVQCICEGEPPRLPLRVADCLFRIGQEAISNAVLHAEATCLSIRIRYEERQLTLEIADDGHGIPGEATSTGTGLFGMSKRAELIGAYFDVASGPGGTRVIVAVEVAPQLHWFGIPFLFRPRPASRQAT